MGTSATATTETDTTITADPGTPAARAGEEQARDTRQRGLVPPERLAQVKVVIIGAGAIGRQVALQVASMGVGRIWVIDFDHVETVNLGPQGYRPDQIGMKKVEATAADILALLPECEVMVDAGRFRRSMADGFDKDTAVFACVDSMEGRGLIATAAKEGNAGVLIDGRMAAEVIRVVTAPDPATDEKYATTLVSDGEAFAGPCTARSTIYTAAIAAGMMLHQFARWVRGHELIRDQIFVMPAGEYEVDFM